MQLKADFAITPLSGAINPLVPLLNPLGPLSSLPGTWIGKGFNQIWRPHQDGAQDRFLQLNETLETLQFDAIPGDIPNRGLLQRDISLHGMTYLQQVQDAHVLGPNKHPAGIHIEPGIWINIPATTSPADAATVARLATIPHGTTILLQGGLVPSVSHAPAIPAVSITPFTIQSPHGPVSFPESNLGTPTAFRTPPADIPGVTQAMVNNPNLVLTQALAGQKVISTTTLHVSSLPLKPPASGGGTRNIAFLDGIGGKPNATSAQVDATFWIETVETAPGVTHLQVQYTQTVLLNFNGLSWPHVSVATLLKQ